MAHKILRHGLEIKILAAVTAATTVFCVGIGAQPSKASAFKYLGEGKSWNNTTSPIHAKDISVRGNQLSAMIKFRMNAVNNKLQTIMVFVDFRQPRSFQFASENYANHGSQEFGWARALRNSYCPSEVTDWTANQPELNYPGRIRYSSSPAPAQTSSSIKTPSAVPSRIVVSGNDEFHDKCKDARDYQGCVDSFAGRRSSSHSSDYEQRMLEIEMEKLRALEQELDRARRHAREQEEREYARSERQRKKELMDVFHKGINDLGDAFKGPDILHCDTSNYGLFPQQPVIKTWRRVLTGRCTRICRSRRLRLGTPVQIIAIKAV